VSSLFVLALWTALGVTGLWWDTRITLHVARAASPAVQKEIAESFEDAAQVSWFFVVLAALTGPFLLGFAGYRRLLLARVRREQRAYRAWLEERLADVAKREAHLKALDDGTYDVHETLGQAARAKTNFERELRVLRAEDLG